MQVLTYFYNYWKSLSLLPKFGLLGLLLLFSYLPWHFFFVNGVVPGPYGAALFLHEFFFLGFWLLLLLTSFISFVFPVISLRGVQRRWPKTLGLGLLAVATIVASAPLSIVSGAGIYGIVLLLFLAVGLNVVWIVSALNRFPRRIRHHMSVSFLLIVVLTIELIPFNGYGIDHVDTLAVNTWDKSYHLSYMSFDAYGKLSLYECGPAKLLCRKVYHYCNNLGPGGSGRLVWADDRLTLMLQSTKLYQRFEADKNKLDGEIDPSWADWHSNNACPYSLWG